MTGPAEATIVMLLTPDLLFILVIGGDHLKEGNDALQKALKNPMLALHYAVVEAKHLRSKFFS